MTLEDELAVGYIRAGLQAGYYLFLPPALYARGVTVLRKAGASDDEIARVRQIGPIPVNLTWRELEA